MVTEYILGNSMLHDRLCAMAEVLGRLVSSAPRAVSIVQLEEASGRSAKELIKLCGSLWRAGLLLPDPAVGNRWKLACEPGTVTLEDVFRCVLSEPQKRGKATPKPVPALRGDSAVDLLVMQAMIAINQSVFKHLRQFSLDRIKVSTAGSFSSGRTPLVNACLDDAADLAVAGPGAVAASKNRRSTFAAYCQADSACRPGSVSCNRPCEYCPPTARSICTTR